MLSPEEAARRLEGFRAREPEHGLRVPTLLAGPLAFEVGQTFADRDRPVQPVAAKLDALPERKLAKVFRAFAPEAAADIARWWIWARATPYQSGWDRRGYRSPRPEHSAEARWHDLFALLTLAQRYPQPVRWHADWAVHLGYYARTGGLLAAAIDAGDHAVRDALLDSVNGRSEIGGPNENAYVALLACADPACWEAVAENLRGAQRSEGLRQTILESVDLAHPGALARIIDAVVEHDLVRFAATVRAAGVWVGEEFEVRQSAEIGRNLVLLRDFLTRPPAVRDLANAPGPAAFLGLWALAYSDATAAIPVAGALLQHPEPTHRLAAARLLADLALPEALDLLGVALADPDPAVYAAAVSAWPVQHYYVKTIGADLPASVRAALADRVRTLGKATEVSTAICGGKRTVQIGSSLAADVLVCYSPLADLSPDLVKAASAVGRYNAVVRWAEQKPPRRDVLYPFLLDASSQIRGVVAGVLSGLGAPTRSEAELLENALRRSAADLRSTALGLLRTQPAEAVAASIERLSAGNAEQQRAGEELARATGTDTADTPGTSSGTAAPDTIPVTLRFGADDRTPAVRPGAVPSGYFDGYHQGAARAWTSLSAWLAEHADTEVRTEWGEVQLLANVRWINGTSDGLPLPEVMEPWWERTKDSLTDGGLEVALLAVRGVDHASWMNRANQRVVGALPATPGDDPSLRNSLLWHVARHAWRPSWTGPVLSQLELYAAELPLDELDGVPAYRRKRGRPVEQDQWGNLTNEPDARSLVNLRDLSTVFEQAQRAGDLDQYLPRIWRLARFFDEPEGTFDIFDGPRVADERRTYIGQTVLVRHVPDQAFRLPPPGALVVAAYDGGVATRADLVEALLELEGRSGGYWGNHGLLSQLTSLRPPEWGRSPAVTAVVDEVRDALVEAQLNRGDLPTVLSPTARMLRSAYGAEGLLRAVTALGKRPFARGYAWTDSRDSALSHLIRIHQPTPTDSVEEFGRLAGKLGEKRLVEVAVYAPQWAALVGGHLDWPGLESAVWWVHAHTNDNSWSVDQEIRAQWASEVSRRTPLEPDDLVRGAADVAWFGAVIDDLGEDRFDQVLAAAKYASSAGGHKRAVLFADALRGRVPAGDLVERITGKRHQDSVRALGLVPLPAGDEAVLLERYEFLRGFVAGDRSSGSQRRASETTAVEVGLENLARTAGFRDPQRLIWAMEADAVRDLADGPLEAADGDLVVTLRIDERGAPEIAVRRGDKTLKAVPAKSAKVPAIAALRERATTLRAQTARMRRSLESSCVTGEEFTPDELGDLLRHPVLAPMLRDLVLVRADGVAGNLAADGTGLVGPGGEARGWGGGSLRIAHPVDLLASDEWPELQHAAMQGQVRQPFRQLFRELYTPTESERADDGRRSRRYAGHQLAARQAGGIFTSRGWVADFEQGFSRTFHSERITAWCSLLEGWGTPAEVEDATVEDVTFHRGGQALLLDEVPPRIFSEVMRDLDLVVSVAHSGGFIPETSESSLEMRARLVEETADLLGLRNVETTGHHARIRGGLGSYSVHLGSGVVHLVPGNAICIIPVSAQHRGRIFLPFADDDPRTAEVISKVVLLARDDKISDPTILEQIASTGRS